MAGCCTPGMALHNAPAVSESTGSRSGGNEISETPLIDRIWQAEPGRFIGLGTLLAQARASRIVLLGETHDNPAHHIWQNRLLAALSTQSPPPVLLMEQFDLEQQPAIDAILLSSDGPERRAAALSALMPAGWERAGYASLLRTAARFQLPIVAANLSRPALRAVSRNGFGALGAHEAQRLGLEGGFWRPEQQAVLESDVAEGHCGTLPPPAVRAIALAQRARDAILADRILMASQRPGQPLVVAILGRGHARRDLAVPLYLAQRAPERRVLAVDLDEVSESESGPDAGRRRPREYAQGALGPLYDVVVFSAPVLRQEDPCGRLTAPKSGAAGTAKKK